MQYQTEQINRELIEFLGKKADALTKSRFSNSDNSPYINQVVRSQQVTIVGGKGRMGRFFSSHLSQRGHLVKILESQDWEQAEGLLAGADLVLVCVPIAYTLETISRLSAYLSPTTALADITSIKAPIVKAMLNCHQGPVMGLHPMFGPGLESFSAQKVVVCSGRQKVAFSWLLSLIQNDGGELIYATPEEHDRMMATVQAVRNFATFSFGSFLSADRVEVGRSLDFSSPAYRQQIEMVQRLFTQSAPMVVDIILASPESRAAIAQLGNVCSRLAQLVEQGERSALIEEFESANGFFQSKL